MQSIFERREMGVRKIDWRTQFSLVMQQQISIHWIYIHNRIDHIIINQLHNNENNYNDNENIESTSSSYNHFHFYIHWSTKRSELFSYLECKFPTIITRIRILIS